jgi:hypothetical protein
VTLPSKYPDTGCDFGGCSWCGKAFDSAFALGSTIRRLEGQNYHADCAKNVNLTKDGRTQPSGPPYDTLEERDMDKHED